MAGASSFGSGEGHFPCNYHTSCYTLLIRCGTPSKASSVFFKLLASWDIYSFGYLSIIAFFEASERQII